MAEAFDPDKFLAETAPAAGAFDPDAFLSETAPLEPAPPANPGVAARQQNREAYRAAVARMKAGQPEEPGDRQLISGAGMAADLSGDVYPGQRENRQLAAGAGLTFGALPRLRALARSAFGPETYEVAKKEELAKLATANEAEPETAGLGVGLSIATPLPELKALEGAGALKALGRIGMRGAEGSAINLAGGDDSVSPLRRLLVGYGVGAGAGLLGEGLSSVGSGGAEKVRNAEADAAALADRKLGKSERSSRSGLAGEVSDVLNKLRHSVNAVEDKLGIYTPEQVAAAQARLQDPNFVKLVRDAFDRSLEEGAESMSGKLATAKNVYESAKAAHSPEAVEAAAEEMLANPISKQIMPRVIRYAKRAPVAIGGLAGPAGAFVGEQVANRLGDVGTASANAARSPGMRKLFGLIQSGVGGSGADALRRVSRLIPPAAALKANASR